MAGEYAKIARDSLWSNNVVLAQMIGLCPTMAVTTSATNGLGMGLATAAVLAASNLLVSLLRNWTTHEVRIPVFILIIASMVSLVDMAMNAWLHELYKILGLFIALIVANCAVLGRAEAFASREPPLASLTDGLMMGLGFTMALTLVGAVREVLGSGTVFAGASQLLGQSFSFMELTIIPHYRGYLLMILPPGGFLAIGFLLAGKRLLDARVANRRTARGPAIPAVPVRG